MNDISTPLRLNQFDTARMPRRFVFLMCALYLIPGLVWRGVWRQEAESLGIIVSMAHGSTIDWLYPNVAGIYVNQFGPMPYWIGAVFIKLFGSMLGEFTAVQIGILAQNACTFYLLWYAIYRLAVRPEMQPQTLAFGGQPLAKDYARLIADTALLFFISTYGVVTHTHDVSEGTTFLLASTIWLYGAINSIERPHKNAWVWGLGLAMIGLTMPTGLYLGFAFASLVLLLSPAWRSHVLYAAPIVLILGSCLPLLWFYEVSLNPDFMVLWLTQLQFSPAQTKDLQFLLRNFFVFTWPLWPFALWGFWQWRQHWQTALFTLSGVLLLMPLLNILITGKLSAITMLSFIPGLLLMATFSLPTITRQRLSVLDWFTMVMFSILMMLIWSGWAGMLLDTTGVLGSSTTKDIWVTLSKYLTLGNHVDARFKWWPVLISLFVTVSWSGLVMWRATNINAALWRSIVLPAAGLTATWVLLATLILPILDFTRSYRLPGFALNRLVDKNSCVSTYQLPTDLRGAILFYTDIEFSNQPLGVSPCQWLLTTNTNVNQNNQQNNVMINQQIWQIKWIDPRNISSGKQLVLLKK